jgi:hypothetical protein
MSCACDKGECEYQEDEWCNVESFLDQLANEGGRWTQINNDDNRYFLHIVFRGEDALDSLMQIMNNHETYLSTLASQSKNKCQFANEMLLAKKAIQKHLKQDKF